MSHNDQMRAVLFDAYGTLFRLDVIESACAMALGSINRDRPRPDGQPTAAELALLWRIKQLEYSTHRSLIGEQHYIDFAAITAEALDYVLARFALDLMPASRAMLLRAWQTLKADPDAHGALKEIAPIPCAILSNGSPSMLDEAVAASGLSDHLVAVLSADAARVYKPDPRVYALGADHFGFAPSEIAFVTANSWDAAGAGAFGYRVCWVNRLGLPADRHGPPPAVIVSSLAAVPNALLEGR